MPADAPLSADLAGGLCAPARSGSCSSGCCGSGRSRSPSRSCGSTRSAAAASSTGSSSASTTSGTARARRRSPPRRSSGCGTIAGEECDAARDRGETGYPAMWEADRVELIEDCVRWLEHERDDELTRALPLVAVEARFGQRMAGEKQGSLSQTEPIEIELPVRHAAAARPDRPRQLGPASARASGSSTTRPARSTRRSPPSCRAGGCCSCRCTCSRPRSCSGSTRPAGAAAYVYPTRKGEFQIGRLDSRRSSPPARPTCSRCSTRSSPPPAAGDFIIAPSEGACDYCPFNGICAGARGDYAERKADRRAARPARDRDPERPMSARLERPGRARADHRRARRQPRGRGRRRHRQDHRARGAGHQRARDGHGDGRRAGGDHLHREGGGRALDARARRARATRGRERRARSASGC